MNYICSLPYEVGYNLIVKCFKDKSERLLENKLWDVWLVKFEKMTEKTFQSWESFLEEKKHFTKVSKKPTKEIYKDSISIYKNSMEILNRR